ncbi:hypothetical protein [Anaerotignum sp.]|uniref:hypothetical protein n=1 Tax=Anaerotignum sp. TaxID=2039241 RepID=UPI00289D0535|nr:hypothetical protein [Anaerotignum sp.]
MRNLLKKIVGLSMATMMALSMGVVAFAQDAPGYVTFFKSGSSTVVSMTQKAIGGYSNKVRIGDNYVYTINLQTFEMTKMGLSGEGYMTGITLGSEAKNAGITASVTNGGDTLIVSVPTNLVINGNSAKYDAKIEAEVELLWGIKFDMPSSVNLAITDSQLTYSE